MWGFDSHLRRYFTNDASGNIVIRDVETDRELATLPGGGVPLTAMIGSRDDRFLATSDENGQAAIWNIETRKVVAVDFPKGAALASFTPDGNALIVRRADGSLHFQNSNSGAEEKIWNGELAAGGIYFNPRGDVFLGAVETDITIHESTGGTLLRKLSHPESVYATAWHPDGRRLATACGKTIYFWDTVTGRELGVAEGHDSRVVNLAFDESGRVLISVGWDNTTRLWQSETRRELVKCSQAGNGLRLSPDGRRLAFQSWDSSRVELWEVASGRELRRFELPASERKIYLTTYHGGFSRDGTLLHLDGFAGSYLFDAQSLLPLALLPSPHPGGAGVFHPAGTSFIHGTELGLFRWPIESGRAGAPVRVGPPQLLPFSQARTMHGVSLSADGRFLVTNDREDLWVVNLHDATTVLQARSRIRLGVNPAISADGRWVAIGSPRGGDDSLQIWDTRNGKVVTNLHVGVESSVIFSPDDRWLLSATLAEYRYWETGSWKPGVRLKRSASNAAWGCAFSPDGAVVALGMAEHTIHLFAAGTERELAALPAGHLVVNVCFSPDGTQLLLTYEAGVAELWDLRLIREQLAELNLDWDSSSFAPVAGQPKDWSYRRPMSMIVVTNESATARQFPASAPAR
jgi:WD40 repeat protein